MDLKFGRPSEQFSGGLSASPGSLALYYLSFGFMTVLWECWEGKPWSNSQLLLKWGEGSACWSSGAINYQEWFMADRPCHQLYLSAVFWKGTNEPLHQRALIGYNCGFCSVSRSVCCSSGRLPRSPVVNKNVIPCRWEIPFSLCLLENLQVQSIPPWRQSGWAFSLHRLNFRALRWEGCSSSFHPWQPALLSQITCSQAERMLLFQCCPSMQLQEARTPGRCVWTETPAQWGQEVTAAPKALLALRLTDIAHLAIKITLSAFIFGTELLKSSCMKTCLLGMQ